MMNFRDHAANGRRVGMLHHLLHPAEAQATNGLPHPSRAADKTHHPLDLQRRRVLVCLAIRCFLGRFHSLFTSLYAEAGSSAPLPRPSATFAASFKCKSASNVALITL